MWVDAEISQSAGSVSQNFHRSNFDRKPVLTHNEDEGSSMDSEVRALKAQLKCVNQDVTKLKKQNSTLKTLLVVSWVFFAIIGGLLFGNLKTNDMLSLP